MKKYILSIDQGTTSTRAILFDKKGEIVASAQEEIGCFYPHDGWVEQDAIDIWLSVLAVINELLIKANLTLKNIDCIGITNQRETAIVWDKKTGMPVYNAIVWQSRQSTAICDALKDKKELIHQKTGLIINPYFSASKVRFILDHIKDGQKRAEKGELLFGTVDTWILYKLTNDNVHATDVSNASRTLLYNIHTLKWDDELLALFNIPKIMLPKVCPSSYLYGLSEFFNTSVPITGIAGDQQAALFGQMCLSKGSCKNTYGTGCFLLMNTGSKPVISKNGLLTTIAWQIDNKVTYALEGSVYIGGAAVQWLRDQMKMISTAAESEDVALSVTTNNHIYIVPAFVGLGSPYWDDKARGAVFGLTRSANRPHFVRATLESIAFQSKDVFEVMKEETGVELKTIKVDGGATANNYLMQFQSDILNATIKVPHILETTALGVCYLAGLKTGYFGSTTEIRKIHQYDRQFKPKMSEVDRVRKYKNWKRAVAATRQFI